MPHKHIVLFQEHEIKLGTYNLIDDWSNDIIKKYGYKYIINDLPEDMIISNFVDKLPKKIISLFS